jgi:metal-dependent amidase/aminoacylase/carboxypeptidase family protein
MISRQYIEADFRGKNAHASGNPWMGINALDAAVAAYNNISLLRQQTFPDDRIHAVFLDGEKVINIIPARARVAFQARSPTLNGLQALVTRVIKAIEAASSATGCEVDIRKYAFVSHDRRKMKIAVADKSKLGNPTMRMLP